MNELFKESHEYSKVADELIESSNIKALLSKYGEVIFKGAYAANLMMDGDIDIVIVGERDFTQDEILKIFNDLFLSTNKDFRSYYVRGNWDDVVRGEELPFGDYLGMKTRINKKKWKIDLWFIGPNEEERLNKDRFDITKVEITDSQRETILKFKKYRKENKLDISGQKIYELVIKKGVVDIENFIAELGI